MPRINEDRHGKRDREKERKRKNKERNGRSIISPREANPVTVPSITSDPDSPMGRAVNFTADKAEPFARLPVRERVGRDVITAVRDAGITIGARETSSDQ